MDNEEFLQRLARAVAAGPEAFETFLKEWVTPGLHWRLFDAMIGYLEDLPETEPELALVLSQIFLDFFPEDEYADPSHRGMAWYFRIMALFQKPEPELFLKSLGQALDYCESVREIHGGFLICRNAKIMIRPGLAGEDTLLLLYQRIAAFFNTMGEAGEAFDFLLSAASIFSRQGAYQPAERLLFEANKLAREEGNQDNMREVDAAFGKMAVDRQDHEWAESIFEELIENRRLADLPVPDQDLFNLAVVKMRLKKTDAAYQLFTDIASRTSGKTILNFSAPLHQAICLKDMGDWAGAESVFRALQAEADEIASYEQKDRDVEFNELLIEYELIYSLVTAVNAKPATSIFWFNRAVFRIEDAMQFTVRPHYRKRIRSQYNGRLLHVMLLIRRWAKPADLLPALVALKKTSQSDWLAILAWAEYVEGLPQIPRAEQLKLKRIVTKLHEHSGMILGAEKEQSDDPFLTEVSIATLSAPNDDVSDLPFQDFALLAGELIQHYGLRPVFDFSSLPVLTELLADRLEQKYVLVFVIKANDSYINFILNERSVHCAFFETTHFKAYREALLDYRGKKIPWTTFEKQLAAVVEFIDDQLNAIWDDLPMADQKGMNIFSGVEDAYFPLPEACLANELMLLRLGKGDFTLVQCPIMFPQQHVRRELERMQILINKKGALGLFEPEATVVAGYFPRPAILTVTSDKDIQQQLGKINGADLVHIITHGAPISRFADPADAGLAGEIFNIDTLKALHSAKSQLYFISACNAADTANPLSGATVATNEIIGYTTVLMQNRIAQVIGAKWPLLDQIGFMFANIFYKILGEIGDIQKAYGQTVHLLATEKSAFFLPFAEQLVSGVVKNKLIAEIQNAEKPFDLVFYYATLNLYALV
ncbi:CHAT domain-containing protein [Mucilaginibacter angelicae]|uniref:CHAT domain-containing protein n=1 Tax=Mucilaginibacter angelicae TaxID=869718 RepID=A0ABV6L2W2_9SPHI